MYMVYCSLHASGVCVWCIVCLRCVHGVLCASCVHEVLCASGVFMNVWCVMCLWCVHHFMVYCVPKVCT